MNRPTIDMSRPVALYVTLAAILLLATLVIGRVPLPSMPAWLTLPHQRAIAGGLICLAVICGLGGVQRHLARVRAPWRVPQSQALILFLTFFVLGALGLVLSV